MKTFKQFIAESHSFVEISHDEPPQKWSRIKPIFDKHEVEHHVTTDKSTVFKMPTAHVKSFKHNMKVYGVHVDSADHIKGL